MPSNVSQNPEAKRKNTAKISNQDDSAVTRTYEAAEAKASMNPIKLILLGVKPNLWAALACEVSICWICFLSLVSKVNSRLADVISD